jgi:hypothetical protein
MQPRRLSVIRGEDGKPFAILEEGPRGRYLLPPLVCDLAGNVIAGREMLFSVFAYRVGLEIPVVRNCVPGDLAEIDRRLTALRESLDAQPWPPVLPVADRT